MKELVGCAHVPNMGTLMFHDCLIERQLDPNIESRLELGPPSPLLLSLVGPNETLEIDIEMSKALSSSSQSHQETT